MSASHKDLHSKLTLGGLLVSLGIIYGDIGTSPLYVMKAILGEHIINADIVSITNLAINPTLLC